ncbi:hypothetical protein PALI_a3826 [Pseudoalteromonas aliena SW19]|jgi:hypothetical protein|uniref:Bacteriocin n=1 Tax=Pseudoalteromonas aliena SW19 TaxID=1314866 RepID=A0ABR9DWT7_9GAMM|nr:hypothetical protein [Pseudoalteromonas aliena SW19]
MKALNENEAQEVSGGITCRLEKTIECNDPTKKLKELK